ncbi:Mitochondrial inner membrane protease ATP23 [Kappamyces sp. JEL0829]|nr:Mitochondrial inner membrane protease ATP23 [Kappamyces sp. JEL0829]
MAADLPQAFVADKKIKMLLLELEKCNCAFQGIRFQTCQPETGFAGGFDQANNRIEICSNVPDMIIKRTLRHELIHALDHCTGRLGSRTLQDPSAPPGLPTCQQLARSEIRAASLSGDCDLFQEALRGTLSFSRDWFPRCITRRAVKSLEMLPSCKDQAKASVAENMDFAMNDRYPF